MELKDLIESGGYFVHPITTNDLEHFALFLIERTKQELVHELAEEKKEVYYSVDQVMAILNVSKMTLWRWDKKDDFLHPIKVGGLTRYRKSDIDRMLNPQ